MDPSYRALICITTCRRLDLLRGFLPHYARFCNRDPRFSLLVSLDGTENDYISFCEQWSVPLVFSAEREGVGISKNRVLQRFPDYDYYFFLDDDVELVDGRPFPMHVRIARETGIHHFSLSAGLPRRRTGSSRACGHTIDHGLIGGGQFSFFTREGLRRVGGWHPEFARYRRWGHTEHSHRFPRAGLAPAPFNRIEGLADGFIWHSPPPVTRLLDVDTDVDELSRAERRIMDEELEFVPVATLSDHHFNGQPFDRLETLASTLETGHRYPLLEGREERRARARYHLWKALRTPHSTTRLMLLARAALEWPGNPMLRHHAKRFVFRGGLRRDSADGPGPGSPS